MSPYPFWPKFSGPKQSRGMSSVQELLRDAWLAARKGNLRALSACKAWTCQKLYRIEFYIFRCEHGYFQIILRPAPVCSAKKTQKGPPKCYRGTKLCCKVAKNKQAHIDTNSQPTKETKRDTKKQTTKQTHKQTNEQTNTQTNTLTKRPLASHCKHKHKLPRPGARRRRRRSGRGFSERTL